MSEEKDLSLIIPLYNEEDNVERVVNGLIRELDSHSVDFELILVENGSTDETKRIIEKVARADKRIKPLYLKKNAGYGGGILKGLKEAHGRHLGYLWGDEQIKAEDVLKIYLTLKEDGLDLCKARRVKREDGFKRLVLTRIYNYLFFPLLFNTESRDVNGCPKLFKRQAFLKLNVQSTDWFIDPEIVIKSQKEGLKIGEVPVVFHQRENGVSKVGFSTAIEFIINLLRYRFTGKLPKSKEKDL